MKFLALFINSIVLLKILYVEVCGYGVLFFGCVDSSIGRYIAEYNCFIFYYKVYVCWDIRCLHVFGKLLGIYVAMMIPLSALQDHVETTSSTSPFIQTGYIYGVHGLQGEVRVKPSTDFPELRFSKVEE